MHDGHRDIQTSDLPWRTVADSEHWDVLSVNPRPRTHEPDKANIFRYMFTKSAVGIYSCANLFVADVFYACTAHPVHVYVASTN